jgi:hypothetical protein
MKQTLTPERGHDSVGSDVTVMDADEPEGDGWHELEVRFGEQVWHSHRAARPLLNPR